MRGDDCIMISASRRAAHWRMLPGSPSRRKAYKFRRHYTGFIDDRRYRLRWFSDDEARRKSAFAMGRDIRAICLHFATAYIHLCHAQRRIFKPDSLF